MTDFPNREHANADKAARRRALKALGDLIDEASLLKAGLEATDPPHNLFASDARRLAALSLSVSENLSIAETLRDVREWHEADQAGAMAAEMDQNEPDPPRRGRNVTITGSTGVQYGSGNSQSNIFGGQ